MPVLVHGGTKVASSIELILMYLVKVFPEVKKQVFQDEKLKNENDKREY